MSIYSFLVKFPLPNKNSEPLIELSLEQQRILKVIQEKIKNNEYRLIENQCLCKSPTKNNDTVIATKDRYGLPFQLCLCNNCGLLRTNPRLDNDSLAIFYGSEFSLLHRGSNTPTERYLNYVIPAGERLFAFIRDTIDLNKVVNVLEIGCATGSNLIPFKNVGKHVFGYDYDIGFLQFGIDRGLNLCEGDYYNQVESESQDLVILSHVLEHMTEPLIELAKAISKVKPSRYIYIEVPGVFFIDKRWKQCPAVYFQNDHLFHFYKEYMERIFESLNLNVLYVDQYCRCIVQRPEAWSADSITSFALKGPVVSTKSLQDYLKKTYLVNMLRNKFITLLDGLGVKKITQDLYRRIKFK